MEKIAIWTEAVKTLAKIVVKYPQTAYAGFTFTLQNEWQYVLRVYAYTVPFFQSLELSIWKDLCPALIGIRAHEIDGAYWELLTQSMKKRRVGYLQPTGFSGLCARHFEGCDKASCSLAGEK